MRTTLTLDPDVAAMLKEAVGRGGVSFKEAVNDALRRGLLDRSARPERQWVQRVWPNGGSEMLLSPEDMKQRWLDEETERFLEVTRRQPPPLRD